MLSKIYTGALYGLEVKLVTVETDLAQGLPSLSMVGLPDVTIREARERIRSAIVNSGYKFPAKRITINLSPANTKKEGSHFDLPIAIGVLASIGEVESDKISEYAFIGELSLAGDINRADGVLPLVMGLADCGIKKIFIPADNAEEAGLVRGIDLYPVAKLSRLVEHFSGMERIKPYISKINKTPPQKHGEYDMDFSDVAGQENIKRMVTIACAAMHGLLLIGMPGTGKSMIAKRIPTVLPEMSYEECLEVTKIYSIGGKLSKEIPMITERPFRAPHHTISGPALVGGGGKPRPGELSFAHFGVLFLDEFSEFHRNILEMLRQPLEDKYINIARTGGSASFPCDVMLIAAGNPCPCGYYGSKTHECTCSQLQINQYRSKLSGPLLDRIDLHAEVQPVEYEELEAGSENRQMIKTSSANMRSAVEVARKIQKERYKNEKIKFNSQLTPELINLYCLLDAESKQLLRKAFKTMGLSTRAYHKILKISRTIADIEESEKIKVIHVAEALSYRQRQNKF